MDDLEEPLFLTHKYYDPGYNHFRKCIYANSTGTPTWMAIVEKLEHLNGIRNTDERFVVLALFQDFQISFYSIKFIFDRFDPLNYPDYRPIPNNGHFIPIEIQATLYGLSGIFL